MTDCCNGGEEISSVCCCGGVVEEVAVGMTVNSGADTHNIDVQREAGETETLSGCTWTGEAAPVISGGREREGG